MRFFLLVVFVIASSSSTIAETIDYGNIDRVIGKEPNYKSKPKYALLLFGQKASIRVWVVLDGKTIYVDRNADGDLTAKDERFEKAADVKDVAILDRKGKPRYKITDLSHNPIKEPPCESLMAFVEIAGERECKQYCDAFMDEDPGKAAIAHFDGPLTIEPVKILWKLPTGLKLAAGDNPTDLRAVVGTMSAKYRCWVVVWSHHGEEYAFPKGVTPVVDVEFPSTEGQGKLVKKSYSLDQFC